MNYFKIITEITNFCNFNCRNCFQRDLRKDLKLNFISLDKYRIIIEKILNSRLFKSKCILLTWRGEALLHPEFAALFAMVVDADTKSRESSFIGLNTNCAGLDASMGRNLLDALCHPSRKSTVELVFSIDALSRGKFRSVKGADERDRVYENVERFTHQVIREGVRGLILRYQFLVNDESISEAPVFFEYWRKWFSDLGIIPSLYFDYQDRISIDGSDDRFRIFFHRTDLSDPERKMTSDRLHQELRISIGGTELKSAREEEQCEGVSCLEPLETVSIGLDGQVTLCCKDIFGELAVGNIFSDDLDRLLLSEHAMKIRKAFSDGTFINQYSLCRSCGKNCFSKSPDAVI